MDNNYRDATKDSSVRNPKDSSKEFLTCKKKKTKKIMK